MLAVQREIFRFGPPQNAHGQAYRGAQLPLRRLRKEVSVEEKSEGSHGFPR